MKIKADGSFLEVKLSGDLRKPSLMLRHGAGCSFRTRDQAIEYLGNRFNIISFDARGLGRSSESRDSRTQLPC